MLVHVITRPDVLVTETCSKRLVHVKLKRRHTFLALLYLYLQLESTWLFFLATDNSRFNTNAQLFWPFPLTIGFDWDPWEQSPVPTEVLIRVEEKSKSSWLVGRGLNLIAAYETEDIPIQRITSGPFMDTYPLEWFPRRSCPAQSRQRAASRELPLPKSQYCT